MYNNNISEVLKVGITKIPKTALQQLIRTNSPHISGFKEEAPFQLTKTLRPNCFEADTSVYSFPTADVHLRRQINKVLRKSVVNLPSKWCYQLQSLYTVIICKPQWQRRVD